MAEKFITRQNHDLNKKNYPSKIYIDRKDSVSNNKNLRSILNENEVKSFFEKMVLQFYL